MEGSPLAQISEALNNKAIRKSEHLIKKDKKQKQKNTCNVCYFDVYSVGPLEEAGMHHALRSLVFSISHGLHHNSVYCEP